MKLWIKEIWMLLTLYLSACSTVSFDDSMPRRVKPVADFAPDMQGTYQWSDSLFRNKVEVFYNDVYYDTFPARDSFNLTSAHMVIKEKFLYDVVKSKSYYKMPQADTARLSKKHEGAEKYIQGAYVIYEEASSDTLLNLQKKDELKHDNKAWYLNHALQDDPDEDVDWEILQLVMKNKNEFSIRWTNERDKKKLRCFRNSPKTSFFPVVHLTDAQFDRFAKRGGFRTRFQFKRL